MLQWLRKSPWASVTLAATIFIAGYSTDHFLGDLRSHERRIIALEDDTLLLRTMRLTQAQTLYRLSNVENRLSNVESLVTCIYYNVDHKDCPAHPFFKDKHSSD